MLVVSSIPKIHWGMNGTEPMCPAREKPSIRMGSEGCKYRDAGEDVVKIPSSGPILSPTVQRDVLDPTLLTGPHGLAASKDRVPLEAEAVAHFKALQLRAELEELPQMKGTKSPKVIQMSLSVQLTMWR